jgi:hypothetical protein
MLMECNLFTREDQFDVAAAEAENLSFWFLISILFYY